MGSMRHCMQRGPAFVGLCCAQDTTSIREREMLLPTSSHSNKLI